jgi:hypothetical protein
MVMAVDGARGFGAPAGSAGAGIIGAILSIFVGVAAEPKFDIFVADDGLTVVSISRSEPLSWDDLGSLGEPQQRSGRGRSVVPQSDLPGGEEAAEAIIEGAASTPHATRVPKSGTRADGGVTVVYPGGAKANYYPRSGRERLGPPTIELIDQNGKVVKKLRFR